MMTNKTRETTDAEAWEELASLLAAALLRMHKMQQIEKAHNSTRPGLEVPGETVLSVTSGLLPEAPKREGER